MEEYFLLGTINVDTIQDWVKSLLLLVNNPFCLNLCTNQVSIYWFLKNILQRSRYMQW